MSLSNSTGKSNPTSEAEEVFLDLLSFLSQEEAQNWMRCCYPKQIQAAISREGKTRTAYVKGIRGMYGLKPEIKERRVKVPKVTKSRSKSKQKDLDKLIQEFL